MTKQYVLMNKDLPLVNFNFENIAGDSFILSDPVVQNNSPYSTVKALDLLLHHRLPDKNREHIDKLLDLAEIKCVSDFLDTSFGLSLNDTLWVKPAEADDSISWKQLNLYEMISTRSLRITRSAVREWRECI